MAAFSMTYLPGCEYCRGCDRWDYRLVKAGGEYIKIVSCVHEKACARVYELGQEKQLETMQDDER